MSKEEIALQLAIKALDQLQLRPSTMNNINDYIAKEVSDFYNAIYNNLNYDK